MEYWIDTSRIFIPGKRDSLPLIHMTQNWETLELILKEGFKPSYCAETITNNIKNKSACFPMISTSNVSVDYALSYQKSYGTLGIALDKTWGEINDFNPVLYLERQSDLTNEIIENFENIKASNISELTDFMNGNRINSKSLLTKQLIKIFAHSKNYDGDLIRNKKLLAEKYPFGMEREWRKIIKEDNVPYFIVGTEMDRKTEFNELVKNIRIDYLLEHLKVVIVEENWQAEKIQQIVCDKFGLTKFPTKHIDIRINTIRHVPDEG